MIGSTGMLPNPQVSAIGARSTRAVCWRIRLSDVKTVVAASSHYREYRL
jgi:hypothetical protein